jgi:hypothetical protein
MFLSDVLEGHMFSMCSGDFIGQIFYYQCTKLRSGGVSSLLRNSIKVTSWLLFKTIANVHKS